MKPLFGLSFIAIVMVLVILTAALIGYLSATSSFSRL